FLKYVFFSLYSRGVNYVSIKQTTGIQNLDANSYLNEDFCFPDEFVQAEVANFLDKKTAQIDDAIAIKEQQISLLKERKQIIIQQA
ncbi:restriction endonuclease subunit S, partial [Escherichia coli]|nr:restriction endonuclease subunit S [Escherichia coli]